jgi:DNA-binding transcriptional MerR regulator
MKIGEVAGQAGVSVDTVRFYERVGVLAPPARTASGYRDYEPGTVERIQLTRELQTIGFTLNDAVDALAAHDAGGATCESERWRLDAVLDRVDAKLAELDALRGRIRQAQQACISGDCLLTRAGSSRRGDASSAATGEDRGRDATTA